ncbi:hypothetical protein PYCC9005_005449 [Savitreella phatthalungensis]
MSSSDVVVVTGGANGMGRHFASALLARGLRVSIADVDERRAQSLLLTLHKQAPHHVANLLYTRCDIRSLTQLREVFARTISVFGRIDTVLCVAGVNVPDPFLLARIGGKKASDELPLTNIDVNLKGTLQTVYCALEVMSRGTIVLISSISGHYPSSCQATYSASKAAIVAFGRAIHPLLPSEMRLMSLVPSSYLPPGTPLSSTQPTDPFRQTTAETLGFVDMNLIWSALLGMLDRGKSGDVIEVTPMGIRPDYLHVPTKIEQLERGLRARILNEKVEAGSQIGGEELLLDDLEGQDVILLNTQQSDAVKRIWESAKRRIVCDGAADRLLRLYNCKPTDMPESVLPSTIVGDLDSITNEARDGFGAREVEIIKDTDENSTDFTKAVKLLGDSERIIALGGISGRIDQFFSSLHTLFSHRRIIMVDEQNIICLLQAGAHRIRCGPFGPHCGLVPLEGGVRTRTRGLKWCLDGEQMALSGLISTNNLVTSNEAIVDVDCSGPLLFSIEHNVNKIPEP